MLFGDYLGLLAAAALFVLALAAEEFPPGGRRETESAACIHPHTTSSYTPQCEAAAPEQVIAGLRFGSTAGGCTD